MHVETLEVFELAAAFSSDSHNCPDLAWMLDLATGRFIPPVNLYHSMESGNIRDGVAVWTNAIFCVNTYTAAVCRCDLQQNH